MTEEVKNVKVQGDHVVLETPKPEAAPKLDKHEIESRQKEATERSNYDPVTEEKKAIERMRARDRLEREGKNPDVEKEVAKKLDEDNEAEFAEAKAKYEAGKAASKQVLKDSDEAEKVKAEEEKAKKS